ncbi:DUF3703 domain-containing protein [Pontibacter litorisediminis]|uniref:DUF3703 domain-containing protein n=1 Tax=Pontibacter litorisediminis TaxID=1846260 RepID=UPI003B84AAFD
MQNRQGNDGAAAAPAGRQRRIWTGKIPIGNTGGGNVPPPRAMLILDDLQEIFFHAR